MGADSGGLNDSDLIRAPKVGREVERFACQRSRLPTEDHRELASAVEVVGEDLDRRRVDVQLVPGRRRTGTDR